MKKLLYFLMIMTLASCSTCMIGQIPPQYIYVDSTCGAALPDYLPMITVIDNCEVDTVWQSPTRGTWLTVPTTTVLIRATDNFNNFTDMMFTVTLIDTIPPTIILNDTTLITRVDDIIDDLYDKADWMLARHQSWLDVNVLSDSIFVDWDHYNDIHITWASPEKFLFGTGMRVHTWQSENDTLIFKR